MNIIRFIAGNSKQRNGLYSMIIQPCSFKAQIINTDFEMFNRQVFTIRFDENGVVHNPNDKIQVTLTNTKERTIRFDWIRVQSIAYSAIVQSNLQSVLMLSQWDKELANADKINHHVAPILQQLETEMLLDEIYEMHRQQAIEHALATNDEQLFNRLVTGRFKCHDYLTNET